MKNYLWSIIFIFTILSLFVLLYNRSKIKSMSNVWRIKNYRIHFIICCITAIVPIMSSMNVFAPMPFSECYSLVFKSKNPWSAQISTYYVPVLYYLSIFLGLLFVGILIYQNIRTSRKFFKLKTTDALCVKSRKIVVTLCLITISGTFFWMFYGLSILSSLLGSIIKKILA